MIGHYHEIKEDQKYIVVESSVRKTPSPRTLLGPFHGKKILSATVLNRTALANPDQAADTLIFTDSGADLRLSTNQEWINGRAAVIQAIQPP